jgi:endoglucanase
MNKLKTNFVDKGTPVIVGEYGFASNLAREQSEIRKYTLAVAEAIYSRDMCPVLWDIQRNERPDYYDRRTQTFTDMQFVAGIKEIAGDNIAPIITRQQIAKSIQMRIYAKATDNFIMLDLPAKSRVDIYNLQGKRVYSAATTTSQKLSIPVPAKGIYIATISK